MNQTEARIFGFFVATMRREQEWTLESLAHATHYSYSMIRSIEKGTSQIDKEGRDRFAKLFGFSGFLDNYDQKETMQEKLQHIQNAHNSLLRERRQALLQEILSDRALAASFLFPEYLLAVLFELVLSDGSQSQFTALCRQMEPALEFFSIKELGQYYDLCGMHVEDPALKTRYFQQAFRYDPDSFLINLHMAMEAYFQQHLAEAMTCLDRCKARVFELGSYSRFVQIALLEAQIQIDLGQVDKALSCLHALRSPECKKLDPYSSSEVLSLMAYASMRKNDMKSALGYAEAGLQERSGHPTLHMVAIFAAFRLQDSRLPLFIHQAKDNMKLDDPFSRRMPWNHFIDGIAAWNEKKYREAIAQLELCCQTFEMDPLRSWMLECLIELARKAEDTELAFHYQQKRIDLFRIHMIREF